MVGEMNLTMDTRGFSVFWHRAMRTHLELLWPGTYLCHVGGVHRVHNVTARCQGVNRLVTPLVWGGHLALLGYFGGY